MELDRDQCWDLYWIQLNEWTHCDDEFCGKTHGDEKKEHEWVREYELNKTGQQQKSINTESQTMKTKLNAFKGHSKRVSSTFVCALIHA